MKKIIITGGMGYIGSHTIIELLRQNQYEPISIDSFVNSSKETLNRIYNITGKQVVNHSIDLCDKDALYSVISAYENVVGIIHFAAFRFVPESIIQPLKYYRNNISSLANVLDVCKSCHIPNIIFSSSCSVYGDITTSPVTEHTPQSKATSPYAHTKQIGEQMLIDFYEVWQDMRCIALRYFNPVGADATGLNGENPINPPTALIPYIVQSATGLLPPITVFGNDYATKDGTCIRDFIHVSDVAQAHLLALQYLIDGKQQTGFDVFNVSRGEGISILEALETFKRVTGIDISYTLGKRRVGDVAEIYGSHDKISEMIGWAPTKGLEEMMNSAWKWQQTLLEERRVF